MLLRPFLLCVVLLGSFGASAQETVLDPVTKARIKQVEEGCFTSDGLGLLKRMKKFRVPGVSIAVIQDGRIEWARGYGVADASGKEAVTPSTKFQAASISKSLAAVGAMSLVQNGVLHLDEDVNRTLVSWKVPENPFTLAKPVTLRHLLSHTAGTTIHGFKGYDQGKAIPTLVQILEGTSPANTGAVVVTYTPGSGFRYSGGGYEVAQQLLMDVTHMPFPDFMRKSVLEPVEMHDSSYVQPLDPAFIGMAATGHLEDGKPMAGKWRTHPEMAAAGLWTTPSDLCRFILEIQRALRGESDRILSSASVREMLTRRHENYGLGFGIQGTGASERFGHGGANLGFRAVFVGYSATGQGAAIMSNGDNGDEVIYAVLSGIAQVYQWPKM